MKHSFRFFAATIIFSLLQFCFPQVRCQSILSEFTGMLEEMDSVPVFRAEQLFYIRDWKGKKLRLEIKDADMLFRMVKPFFFPKMHVFIKGESDSVWKSSDVFSFDGKRLECHLPEANCTLKIEYGHRGVYSLKYLKTTPYIRVFLSQWGTAFFTHPDMKWKSVCFQLPQTYALFSNIPYTMCADDSGNGYKRHVYSLSCSANTSWDISFIMANRRFYQERRLDLNNCSLGIWQLDSLSFSEDSTRYVPVPTSGEKLEKAMHEAGMAIQTYNSFFNNEKNLKFSFVDADLTKDDIAIGVSLSDSESGECVVLMDRDCWNNGMKEHEIIHKFMPINPSKGDKTYFFFSESLPEYLSVALTHSGMEEDSLFRRKLEIVQKHPSKQQSVFRITENKMDESGNGSAVVVYQKTPYVLYLFSKEIGKETLLRALQTFYAEVHGENSISLSQMKKVFLQNGVTVGQWKHLMRMLSSPLEKC